MLEFGRVLNYFALLGCGVAVLYSLLITLAGLSVWTVRHEELYELWNYFLLLRPSSHYFGDASVLCYDVDNLVRFSKKGML